AYLTEALGVRNLGPTESLSHGAPPAFPAPPDARQGAQGSCAGARRFRGGHLAANAGWHAGAVPLRRVAGDAPAATVRFDLTPAGFHAQVLSPQGAFYIEPYLRGNTNLHAVYARRDYSPAAPDFQCLAAGSETLAASSAPATPTLV